MAMAFVTTPFSFYLLRFLLGVFEAGFFPGVMLYLTYWIPPAGAHQRLVHDVLRHRRRGRRPIAGLIMSGMDGVAPLRNWQWLFVLEGIPSVIAGIVVLGYLPDRPRQARWLSAAEQTALEAELEAEQRHGGKHASFAQALRQPALWLHGRLLLHRRRQRHAGVLDAVAGARAGRARRAGYRPAVGDPLHAGHRGDGAQWRTPTRPASGACVAPAPRWSARRAR